MFTCISRFFFGCDGMNMGVLSHKYVCLAIYLMPSSLNSCILWSMDVTHLCLKFKNSRIILLEIWLGCMNLYVWIVENVIPSCSLVSLIVRCNFFLLIKLLSKFSSDSVLMSFLSTWCFFFIIKPINWFANYHVTINLII